MKLVKKLNRLDDFIYITAQMFFLHIFYFCSLEAVLCFFVLMKSFGKKIKKFKTDLIASFVLLLFQNSRNRTIVRILGMKEKQSEE